MQARLSCALSQCHTNMPCHGIRVWAGLRSWKLATDLLKSNMAESLKSRLNCAKRMFRSVPGAKSVWPSFSYFF